MLAGKNGRFSVNGQDRVHMVHGTCQAAVGENCTGARGKHRTPEGILALEIILAQLASWRRCMRRC